MNASLAIIHDHVEFDFVESIAVNDGKSVWIALKSNGSGLQWINRRSYENHRQLSDIDICAVAYFSYQNIDWQLEKCFNKDPFYPLCMQGKLML